MPATKNKSWRQTGAPATKQNASGALVAALRTAQRTSVHPTLVVGRWAHPGLRSARPPCQVPERSLSTCTSRIADAQGVAGDPQRHPRAT
eukprot:4910657-Alexandrium_andersonii.AAC.1